MRYRFAWLLLLPVALTACQTVPRPHGFSARQIAVLQENGFASAGDDWSLGISDSPTFRD